MPTVQTLLLLGSGIDMARGFVRSSDPGERYRRGLTPGRVTLGTVVWSGPERWTGLHGVALAIPKALHKSLISWSDRLLSARFLHHGKMILVSRS